MKGLQYSIPYEKHTTFFRDVLDGIKEQTLISFDGDIPLKKLISVIDEHSKTFPLRANPNSYLQAILQAAKLEIFLFIGVANARLIFEQINSRSWDANHFKAWGIDVSTWLQSLQEKMSKREDFLKQIEVNKQDKKILQLKSSEITA